MIYEPCVIRAVDPNDIVGPAGYGEDHWIAAGQPLTYTIHFENDPTRATAPAQAVRITQQLDPDLDYRSFRVGDFGFGDIFVDVPDNQAFYGTRLDLRSTLGLYVDVAAGIDVTTGQAFWTFQAVDPATGLPPTGALQGFLPPNVSSPEGEGFLTYTIRPKADAATGTRIDAQATIVFDNQEPIDTPPVFNTLDQGAPASSVRPLPPGSLEDFEVTWGGDDDAGGSAVASYSVYVSANGGPYSLWLTDTALTSSTYLGEAHHTYAFYARARDNAGNLEPAPPGPDASTVAVPAEITGRYVFYNNSAFDGNNQAANAGDDSAIDPAKSALLPGHTAVEGNVTGYSRGINGIMVDIAGLGNPAGLGAADFAFRAGNSSDLSTWTAAPGPTNDIAADIRLGAGADGSDRVTIIWAGGAVRNGWLEVTVLPTVNTALAGPEVFYFGNLVADMNGDRIVDMADYITWYSHYTRSGSMVPGDVDGNGLVDMADYLSWFTNYTSSLRLPMIAPGEGGGMKAGETELNPAPPQSVLTFAGLAAVSSSLEPPSPAGGATVQFVLPKPSVNVGKQGLTAKPVGAAFAAVRGIQGPAVEHAAGTTRPRHGAWKSERTRSVVDRAVFDVFEMVDRLEPSLVVR